MQDMEAQIQPAPGTPINRDFAPVAYYFDVALWSSQFNQAYRRPFGALAGVRFGVVLAAFGMPLATLAISAKFVRRKQRRLHLAAGFCTAATGFTLIGLEMLLLLGFQAVYGYVYQQLAILIAAFMAGMALGSWLAMRRAARVMRLLAATQIMVAAAPLVVLALLAPLPWSRFAFPAIALMCGLLGGFEFPLASRIFFRGTEPSVDSHLGALYALDLAGSCLGAILFSTWFVPVFGFLKTACCWPL